MKKKILIFAQSGVGGAERMSVTVTKTLDKDKFDIIYYLVGSFDKGLAPLREFIPTGFNVNCVNCNNPFLLIVNFFRILKKERPDIVFASVVNINNKLLLIHNLFKKTKFIIRCDNYLYTYSERQRKIIAKTYYKADLIIAQTDEMRHELITEIGIPEKKVVTLQNPLDDETIKKCVTEGRNPYPLCSNIRYVASGRFTYQKGFDLLVEAFAEVKKQQPKAELYIVGKKDSNCEDYYNEISKIIDYYGLQDCVNCVGYQTNPYVYIKYADCFVLSSRWEGLPNVMIESLYLGTPVAAFKCVPVIERIASDRVNSFLAEKENAHSLAKAMIAASQLGRVISVYKPAKIEDFHKIFDFICK